MAWREPDLRSRKLGLAVWVPGVHLLILAVVIGNQRRAVLAACCVASLIETRKYGRLLDDSRFVTYHHGLKRVSTVGLDTLMRYLSNSLLCL
jgi:hypothetical protein